MHQLPKVPVEEIQARINHFQETLTKLELDGALITQNVDLFYLTGTMQNGILFVPSKGDPHLYVKKSVKRAQFETSISVEPLGRSRELGQKIENRYGKIQRVGLEMDVLPYNQAIRYMKLFPEAQPKDISFELRSQRAVKSPYEIQLIRSAAQKINQVVESLPKLIRPGMTELELVAKIEEFLRLQGNINLYRMRGYNQELVLGMVVSGEAAAIPTSFDGPAGGLGLTVASPQGASQKKIEPGEPILVDIGTVCEGYLIDQTRLAVIGELDSDLKSAYQVAQQILRKVEEIARPGLPWEALYLSALEIVEQHGLSDYFMGYGEDQAKFLGHGIGLELDEFPVLAKRFTQPLEEGMIIAIEPKFTFPGRGVVGLENTYVITETGIEVISLSAEEIIQIEG